MLSNHVNKINYNTFRRLYFDCLKCINVKLILEYIEIFVLNSMEKKIFHEYLQATGAIRILSNALLKLLEIEEKPTNIIEYFRENLGELEQVELENKQLNIELKGKVEYLRNLENGSIEQNYEEIDLNDPTLDTKTLYGFEQMEKDRQCQSLVKKYLSQDILKELIDKRTNTFHSHLYNCIKASLINRRMRLSIFASDASCYDVFYELFHPIINEIHFQLPEDFTHPLTNWGNVNELVDRNIDKFSIEKCQINCLRSLNNFPFHPIMTANDFEKVSNEIHCAIKSSQIDGNFYSMNSVNEDEMTELFEGNFMFARSNAA